MIKRHNYRQSGKERDRLAHSSQFTLHRWRKSGQEHGGRNWCRSHGGTPLTRWPVMAFSACFPMPLRTTCPVAATPRHTPRGPGLSRKYSTQSPTGILREALSQLRLILPNNCSLCRVNNTVTTTSIFSEVNTGTDTEHVLDCELAKWQSQELKAGWLSFGHPLSKFSLSYYPARSLRRSWRVLCCLAVLYNLPCSVFVTEESRTNA